MKNVILLCAFVLSAGFVTAQETATKTCTKSEMKACAKKGKTCAKTCASKAKADATASTDTNVLSASAEAELAAEGNEAIARKECPMTGNITYYQKAVCEKSGKVSMNEVKYCTDSKAFVNASPSEVMSDGEAKVIKTADTVDGKVQTTTKSAAKKCCKGKKACSSSKKKA